MTKRQMASMAFLLVALALFVAFHFLPFHGRYDKGWTVWTGIWEIVSDRILPKGPDIVATTAFINFSMMIVVSPFLKNVWPKSRLAWWVAVVFSGLTGAAIWMVFLIYGRISDLRFAEWCLLFAPLMNFIGLLLARDKPRQSAILSFEREDSRD